MYAGFVIAACKTVGDFQQILDIGVDSHAKYLEFQPEDVDNQEKGYLDDPTAPTDFTAAFLEGHQRLLNANH